LLAWKVLIKCADLGHCFKPWRLHRRWAFRIMEEMYRQGEAELELGNTTIFVAMDRRKLDCAAKSQVRPVVHTSIAFPPVHRTEHTRSQSQPLRYAAIADPPLIPLPFITPVGTVVPWSVSAPLGIDRSAF
jgi:hypothetical protein